MQELNVEDLPNPPGVAVKILELFSNAEASLKEICTVIGIDPVLTARIISYANSPKFARRYRAETLSQAVALLGINGVKMIALSFSLIETTSDNSSHFFKYDEFWKSSLATGICGKHIFDEMDMDSEAGFLYGLLFNVGQLAFANMHAEEYKRICGEKSVCDLGLLQLEQEAFGSSRYQVAGQVLTAWNFPETMIQTLESSADAGGTNARAFKALQLATCMSYSFLVAEPDIEAVKSLWVRFRNLLGMEHEEADDFYSTVKQEYSELAKILDYELPPQRSLLHIEMEAKKRMVELTMDLDLANTRANEEVSALKNMAYIDALTDLGNRRQYESTANAALEQCKRMGRTFGLVVCDIDFFKKVNDVHGHAAGDLILKEVASRLNESLRAYDQVFRFGGEEFVVILPEANSSVIGTIAERMRCSVASKGFKVEDTRIEVTISLGGTVFDPAENNVSIDELFQQADEALYKAKEGGRNQFKMAVPNPGVLPGLATAPVDPNSIPQSGLPN